VATQLVNKITLSEATTTTLKDIPNQCDAFVSSLYDQTPLAHSYPSAFPHFNQTEESGGLEAAAASCSTY
jgi:hypothetical protein